jgi:hypothetical protein
MGVRFRGFFLLYSFAGLPPVAIVGTGFVERAGDKCVQARPAHTEGDT